MANEMNKVPCGGFKVGGGLSVDDGIVRTGGVCALVTLNNKSAGWIFPYDTFCFDKPITKIVLEETTDEAQQEFVVYDIIESLFVPICKLDVQSIGSLDQFEWKIIDHHLINLSELYSYSIQSLVICESSGQKAMMVIGAKGEGLVFKIDIPAEIENIIHFGGKGWLCLGGG